LRHTSETGASGHLILTINTEIHGNVSDTDSRRDRLEANRSELCLSLADERDGKHALWQ
jgi:hypothetical protein